MGVNGGGPPALIPSALFSLPGNPWWTLAAPYVRSADLHAACLVSQQWNDVFTPYLWGSPGSRFGTNSDDVCSSLTKFKRGLKRARYEVRSLTHTLHIPPATPELVDGPQRGWLRECLDRLPYLQSLSVSGVAFFDHECLRTVRRSSTGGWERRRSSEPLESPVAYGLRLLEACFCQNTTSTGLTSALAHFPHLMYLDLSSTIGVRNPCVLRQITCLEQLQVLKLQNCGLRDSDMQYLCFNDANLLRSLDLRNNLLTEAGVATALSGLILAPQYLTSAYREPWHISKADEFEILIKNHLTNGFAHRALLEDDHPGGLSHLYVAGNDLSIESLTGVLGSQELRILDCGSLTTWQTTNGLRSPTSPNRLQVLPSSIVLNLASFMQAFQNLTYLRIHHSIVTEHTFSGGCLSLDEKFTELDAIVPSHEIDSTEIDYVIPEAKPGAVELADTSGLVELMGDLAPHFELEGDSVFLPESQRPSGRAVSDDEQTASIIIHEGKTPHEVHRIATGPVFTPVSRRSTWSDSIVSPSTPHEIGFHFGPTDIDGDYIPSPSIPYEEFHVDATRVGATSQPTDSHHKSLPFGPTSYPTAATHGSVPFAPTSQPKEVTNEHMIEDIASRRRGIRARERKLNALLPSMLPNLRTLILTDVPLKTRSHRVVNALTHFIQECAEEEALARLEATRQRPNIQLLERHEAHAVRKEPRKAFNLQKLTLEMSSSPIPDTPPLTPSRPRSSSEMGSIHRNSFTKSSTEDADSETFMSAAEMDFSFFGDDDCSLLVTEGRIDAPCTGFATSEKMLAPGMGSHLGLPGADAPVVDVIGELSKFRKKSKAAYDANKTFGGCRIDRALLGHWSGDISVVRLNPQR